MNSCQAAKESQMTIAKLLGPKLKKLRREADITQPALAKLLQLAGENSHITISNWERGIRRPTLDHIEGYAKLFNKPISWFFRQPHESHDESTEDEPAVEAVVDLVHRALALLDKIGTHAKFEVAKTRLHRVLMDLEKISPA